jgi:hypothetical protein
VRHRFRPGSRCGANLRPYAWAICGHGGAWEARLICGFLEQAAGPEMKREHVVDIAAKGGTCLGAVDSVVACWPGRVDNSAGGAAGGGRGAMAASP